MDTFISIRIWGKEDLAEQTAQTVMDLDSVFSVTAKTGEIYRLNEEGSASLSGHCRKLIEEAICYSEKTDHCFDPTIYPFVEAWGFTKKENRVPKEDELELLSSYVGTEHIHLTEGAVSLDEGTRLDLGGIAKGYVSQVCVEYLMQSGCEAAILSLGGNVQTIGTKPDGSNWVIGIADPKAPSVPIAEVHFSGSLALVTSGSYQRYFERNGEVYHHLLDPKTGRPAENGLASVTILCENGTMADAYSTALFVMGMEEAVAFWRQERNFEAVFITSEGEIYATSGAAALLQNCEFTEITA